LLALHGYGSAAIDQATDTRHRWQAYLRGTNSRDDAIKALAGAEHQPWFGDTFMSTAEDLTTDPKTSSWRKEMDLDPMQAVKSAHVPLLFIYGGADPWVPVEESVRSLRSLMQSRHDIEVHVVAGVDHTMAINPHETMSFDKAWMLSQHPESPAYFFILGNWLSRHTQVH
jgi:pimeloyl-ACP methyl ester carboxylesterase